MERNSESTWYSARILFQSQVGARDDKDALFEESIRLILADGLDDARTLAESVGRQSEIQYKNDIGETVKWRFVKVLEVQDLSESELGHGTEVFSRMFRGDDPHADATATE